MSKFFKNRWDDEKLSKGCFAWLKEWRTCPSYIIAGMHELYQELLPKKLYYHKKTRTNLNQDVLCRVCGKNPESVPHISALAQKKLYLSRYNAALVILFVCLFVCLFFELLKDLKLVSKVPPWRFRPTSSMRRANRVDARIINHETRSVSALGMSCPRVGNPSTKDAEKTLKYDHLWWELNSSIPGIRLKEYNIIIDALGIWYTERTWEVDDRGFWSKGWQDL